jgi:hypothetical protein
MEISFSGGRNQSIRRLEKRDYIGNNMLSWSVFVTHRFSNLVVLPHIRPDVRCTVMVELN